MIRVRYVSYKTPIASRVIGEPQRGDRCGLTEVRGGKVQVESKFRNSLLRSSHNLKSHTSRRRILQKLAETLGTVQDS